MAEKTQFDTDSDPLPAREHACCYNCHFANRDVNTPMGTNSSSQRFVECIHSPPSVVVIPAGIDPHAGQVRVALQAKFPIMGYGQFCYRFETRRVD